jgi:predicted MFS family arabinose efflux permease
VSGVLLLLAALAAPRPWLSLALLLVSRLVLGFGESWVGTGSILWGIGKVGTGNTARVISWNGIATYGGLALGAPLGVVLAHSVGFASLGLVVIVLAALGVGLAAVTAAVPVVHGERLAFKLVLGKVLPHGISLALASVGFGAIATFITLFYASRNWPNAAFSLTVFGALYIGSRLVLGNTIKLYGGFRVAIASLVFEACGLALLWQASNPGMALAGAALSGFGFALIFPSLGVEAVSLVPPASRGSALSAYSVFLDLSLGITGPLAGLIAGQFDYAAVFLFASLASLCAVGLTLALYFKSRSGGIDTAAA